MNQSYTPTDYASLMQKNIDLTNKLESYGRLVDVINQLDVNEGVSPAVVYSLQSLADNAGRATRLGSIKTAVLSESIQTSSDIIAIALENHRLISMLSLIADSMESAMNGDDYKSSVQQMSDATFFSPFHVQPDEIHQQNVQFLSSIRALIKTGTPRTDECLLDVLAEGVSFFARSLRNEAATMKESGKLRRA